MRPTATTGPAPQQPDLAGLSEAIAKMQRDIERQTKALRKLFESHGFDLANGDMLFHAPGEGMAVPPQFATQVCASPYVKPGDVLFMRNPKFSLF